MNNTYRNSNKTTQALQDISAIHSKKIATPHVTNEKATMTFNIVSMKKICYILGLSPLQVTQDLLHISVINREKWF